MKHEEINALEKAFQRQGLTPDQIDFVIAVLRNRVELLQQQVAERDAQIVLLRDGVAMAVSIIGHPDDDGTKHLQKILADTDGARP